MSQVAIPYGESYIELPLDRFREASVLSPAAPHAHHSPEDIVISSLLHPKGHPGFLNAVRGKKRVGIVIPDITRYSGTDVYLPLMVELLEKNGFSPEQVTLFAALGIHRPMDEGELSLITGGLSSRLRIVQNDPDGGTNFLGETSRGTPVSVNGDLLACDGIIVTGTASFHYFAGFGGGRKLLVPGMAGRDTCYRTHYRIFDEKGRHPMARPGILAGNPVHEDMLEGASLVPVSFTLTTCLTPERALFASFGGSLTTSHHMACEIYSTYYKIPLAKRYEFIIASAGGHPKDINFIQSHKALEHAFQALTPGGILILFARCPEGMGHEDFFPWFRFENLDEFERELRRNYVIYGQTAYATFVKAKSARIILVSDLPEEEVRKMGLIPAQDGDDAFRIAEDLGASFEEVLVIPQAGYVLPEPTR